MKKLFIALSVAIALASPQLAAAEDFKVTLKDTKFSPEPLVLPAGQKVKLIVVNDNAAPMEFESHELNREKVISGNSQATVFLGPLDAGSYPYFDEFQKDAKGTIVVK